VIGRRPGVELEGAEYRVCDVNDYPALREAVRGCDAIVHLAAIANPGFGQPEEIFRVNCSGSFNVFQAAAQEGIRRVVQASSINATGQFFGLKPAPLHYLPIDEEHPVFSTDAYSYSKNVIENTGEFFWHREGISSLALRLPWVAPAEIHAGLDGWREGIKTFCADLYARPLDERRAWFKQAWQEYNEYRAGRPYEPPKAQETWESEDYPENSNPALMAMSQRVNFFTMLDERDSAQAIEKGLTTPFEGAHTLFINDNLNWTGVETAVLADLFYPDVPIHKKRLTGADTLVSIDKARRLIGFKPEYTFGG
jgi:nucleoside-diphosphate-sugar epimerase